MLNHASRDRRASFARVHIQWKVQWKVWKVRRPAEWTRCSRHRKREQLISYQMAVSFFKPPKLNSSLDRVYHGLSIGEPHIASSCIYCVPQLVIGVLWDATGALQRVLCLICMMTCSTCPLCKQSALHCYNVASPKMFELLFNNYLIYLQWVCDLWWIYHSLFIL